MDAKDRWQALQAKLSAARAYVDIGDRTRALIEIDAALAIDPEFLAAHTLRDQLLTPATAIAPAVPFESAASAAAPSSLEAAAAPLATPSSLDTATTSLPGAPFDTATALANAAPFQTPAAPVADASPLVSAEGYARFEQRAKRRRVDRRVEAAREAIARDKLMEAASAIDEIRELDPNLPELPALVNALQAARKGRGLWLHRGWAAAAVVLVAALSISWVAQTRARLHRVMMEITSGVTSIQPAPSTPAPVATSTVETPPASVGTSGRPVAETATLPSLQITPTMSEIVPQSAPVSATSSAVPRPALPATQPQTIAKAPSPVVEAPARSMTPPRTAAKPPTSNVPPPPADAAPRPIQRAAEPLPKPAPSVPSTRAPETAQPAIDMQPAQTPPLAAQAADTAPRLPQTAVRSAAPPRPTQEFTSIPAAVRHDDSWQVEQALQRYRSAYDGLDARSARDVWPAVNEAALARAFDGLESQRLTFDACTVDLRGESAFATCRGTARYVPKVGRREPRVEPRIWSFTLHKTDSDWKIDTARAER